MQALSIIRQHGKDVLAQDKVKSPGSSADLSVWIVFATGIWRLADLVANLSLENAPILCSAFSSKVCCDDLLENKGSKEAEKLYLEAYRIFDNALILHSLSEANESGELILYDYEGVIELANSVMLLQVT
ncbi:unnamed protein product [Protopolystoma xenopodis]|uniref:Uncharacterized protein n=1 Tax=Protopolystoma xenopodis TaxID=117903 RepID=A0A3S5CUZ5_9PLAT|nr:unnamed protein product [Protopolystoma xenopodis]